jgi:TolB-like protein
MNNAMLRLVLMAFAVAIPPVIQAQDARSYPLAVLPFAERGKDTKDLGAKVADLLFAKLASEPGIVLVEREREDFRKVLDETQLDLSALVNDGKAAKVGHFIGAKLLVTGSVVQVDGTFHLVAKIIGTETGRVLGSEAQGNAQNDLSSLVSDLSKQVSEAVRKSGDNLVATELTLDDRLAALKEKLTQSRRPRVLVQISERPASCPAIHAAAETELMLFCSELGFPVIDRRTGSKETADVLILGEATSVVGLRNGPLISAKVRLEVKAVDRRSGLVLAVDRETARAVDLNEHLAANAGLQQAAATIAGRMLPKIVQGGDSHTEVPRRNDE